MAPQENPISPVTTKKPDFVYPTAAINSEPVELESTPISQQGLREPGPKSVEEAMPVLSPEDQKVWHSH